MLKIISRIIFISSLVGMYFMWFPSKHDVELMNELTDRSLEILEEGSSV